MTLINRKRKRENPAHTRFSTDLRKTGDGVSRRGRADRILPRFVRVARPSHTAVTAIQTRAVHQQK